MEVKELVALIGISVTLMLGFINIILSLHNAKRSGITENRMEWINFVRRVTADIVSYDYNSIVTVDELMKTNTNLLKSAYLLNLYLNVAGKFDNVIMKYLNDIIKYKKSQHNDDKEIGNFIKAKRLFNLSMQIYLKVEWNRVKRENKVIFKLPFYSEKRAVKKQLKNFSKNDTIVNEIREIYDNTLKQKDKKALVFSEFINVKATTSISVGATVSNENHQD